MIDSRRLADRPVLRLFALLLVLALSGCETVADFMGYDPEQDKPVDGYVERHVEAIYNEAMDHMEAGWYKTAAELFDDVERQHPYSAWATKAQLMAAYANYLRDAYDEAVIGIDRFTALPPGHSDIDYAYYLKP